MNKIILRIDDFKYKNNILSETYQEMVYQLYKKLVITLQ